jgi:hypothetical protein
MAPSKPPARLRKIVRAALDAGWTYDTTKKGHPRLTPPRGQRHADGTLVAPVTFALTPSDHRGDRQGVAYLRRAGIRL